jgi:hypothetical protein
MAGLIDSVLCKIQGFCDESADAERWRTFVAEREATTQYHTQVWKEMIETAFACDPTCRPIGDGETGEMMRND